MGRGIALSLALLALAAGTGTLPAPARAGESMDGAAPVLAAADTARFAKQVEDELARRGARVALVARAGRDRDDLPPGVRYTHVAWWVYSEIRLADGRTVRGYAAHNLYQSAESPDRSTLAQDFPVEFFRAATILEAGLVVPEPPVQAKLLAAIAEGRPATLHLPRYSVVASPYDLRYQNCTEHALDLLLSALYGTTDQARLKRIARQHFQAQPIPMGPLTRGLGPLFVRGIATDDQDGPVRTATFETIGRFMLANGLATEVVELRAPP